MLKSNSFKAKKNSYKIEYTPLIELYKKLCEMEAPYLWYRDGRYHEALYYIEDIWTVVGPRGYFPDSTGIEMPDGWEESICVRLSQMRCGTKYECIRSIDYDALRKIGKSIEQFLADSRIRIPDAQELSEADNVDGIPIYKDEL